MHSSIREVLLSWHETFVGKKRKKAWKVAPLRLFWTLWRERNRRAFHNYESIDQAIKIISCIHFGIGFGCILKTVHYCC